MAKQKKVNHCVKIIKIVLSPLNLEKSSHDWLRIDQKVEFARNDLSNWKISRKFDINISIDKPSGIT